LLGAAKQSMDEEHDQVKQMNQMMLYAQCVTIRDAQILEKQKIADEKIVEEKRADLAMEIERLKSIAIQQQREKIRGEEQKAGASVIILQIAEREQERIRAQEQRDQEAAAMLLHIQELEKKEEEDRIAKIVAGRKMLSSVMTANQLQAKAKLVKKQEELDEDIRITEYIKRKEQREREAEEEAERIRSEKEKEVARLRAQQERALDRQSAIDELRAKRYQEAKDRQWRQQQMEAAAKKRSAKLEITMAREQQRNEKIKLIAEQTLQEKEEAQRVGGWHQQQIEMEKERERMMAEQRQLHRLSLLQQIQEKEKEKKEARSHYLEEGKIVTAQLEADKTKLQKLKHEKLELLEKMGVPEKYRSELAKKKIMVASIH
jgi:hypothetical protein